MAEFPAEEHGSLDLPAGQKIFYAPLDGKKHDYQIVFRRGFGSTYWRRSGAATAS
ncbi:hypothetical protein X734_20630 [Mesorhizobium sp. L2C084A000]|nr:hypothetical protein X734_20630 [Mesorhizobium sp. L2C084A000]